MVAEGVKDAKAEIDEIERTERFRVSVCRSEARQTKSIAGASVSVAATMRDQHDGGVGRRRSCCQAAS